MGEEYGRSMGGDTCVSEQDGKSWGDDRIEHVSHRKPIILPCFGTSSAYFGCSKRLSRYEIWGREASRLQMEGGHGTLCRWPLRTRIPDEESGVQDSTGLILKASARF